MRPRRRTWLALGFAALAFARPVAAEEDAALLDRLGRQDLRVATVAFRLLRAGVPLCTETAPASGLLIHDVRQYAIALRPAAIRAFGFAGRPAVAAVVPGSPADRAGIRARDTIAGIDGMPVAPIAAPVPDLRKPSFDAAGEVETRLAAAMTRGAVTLALVRDGAALTVRLDPQPACASPVQLQPDTKYNAWSDGRGVAITSALAGATQNDDELATVIGHEIAHNILHHRGRLEAQGVGTGLFSRIGSKARKVRETESEADYVGLYLAARAGYDPAAAALFWRRFGAAHNGGFFADGTHPKGDEREAALARAAAEIAAKRRRGEALVPSATIP